MSATLPYCMSPAVQADARGNDFVARANLRGMAGDSWHQTRGAACRLQAARLRNSIR